MKQILSLVLVIIMVVCLIFGLCMVINSGGAKNENNSKTDGVVKPVFADLVPIPDYDYLYYSTTTRTVYYLFGYAQRGYMCEYIRNGHTCEYIDGKIIEVIPTVKVEDVTN